MPSDHRLMSLLYTSMRLRLKTEVAAQHDVSDPALYLLPQWEAKGRSPLWWRWCHDRCDQDAETAENLSRPRNMQSTLSNWWWASKACMTKKLLHSLFNAMLHDAILHGCPCYRGCQQLNISESSNLWEVFADSKRLRRFWPEVSWNCRRSGPQSLAIWVISYMLADVKS